MRQWILGAAAAVASVGAHAQFADQTYNFAGTVTSSNDPLIAAGSRITGAYAINLGNVTLDPYWSGAGNVDGPFIGSPWAFNLPAGYGGSIFTASATVDGLRLTTPGGADASNVGGFFLPGFYSEYGARDGADGITILEADHNTPAFAGTGLPTPLTASTAATGTFVTNGYTVTYSIGSMAPVSAPEVDASHAVAALTLLCGAGLVLTSRKRA